MTELHIAYCGPVSLQLLADSLDTSEPLPVGYQYHLGAYLVKRLLAMGHRVTVVTSVHEVKQLKQWKGENLTVYATPRRRHYLFCLDAYRRERRDMVRVLQEAAPDLIHAQWTYEFAHAAMSSGIPTLVTARDSPRAILKHMPGLYRLYRAIYARFVIPRIANLSTISPYMADELRAGYSLSNRDIAIIPNALEGSLFSARSDYSLRRTNPTVAMVSGWGPRKNVKVALQAFVIVRQRNPDAKLVLMGAGLGTGEPAELWAKERGLGAGVEFVGQASHAVALDRLRQEADIFLHTTLEESFCMSVVEAMAQGIPVVAGIDSGAVPWVLGDGEAGVLVDCRDPDAVAVGLQRLIEDPKLREKYGACAFARADTQFRMSRIAGVYLEHYKTILEDANLA
jgi:glycosyltransferase involved in cell wall biosynthesis